MGIFTILKNDLRKRKGQSVIILLLSLLITILLATTVSVIWKSDETYEDMSEKAGTPEIINIYSSQQLAEGTDVYDRLQKQKEVDSSILEDILLMTDNNSVKLGNADWYSDSVFLRAMPKGYSIAEGNREEGGIYLPISLKTSQGLKTGDKVSLKFADGSVEYQIAGFFEDPFLGGTMIGFKQFFMEESTFSCLLDAEASYQGKLLGLWLTPHEGVSTAEVMKDLNEKTKVTSTGTMYTESSLLKMASMLLTDIFMSLIFLFGLLLLVILLITVRYLLLSSMEDDYREIGALHALGYTKGSLIAGKVLQIFLLAAGGGICGFAGSVYTIPVIGSYAMDGTGILWHGGMKVLPALLSVLFIFLIILLVTWLSLRKIGKMSAVQAIRNGNEDIYFKKRCQLPLERLGFLPLPLRMAVKNLSVRLGQFALLVFVCGFMIFSMTSISALNENLHDVKKLSSLFGSTLSDITITDRAAKTPENSRRFGAFMEKLKDLDHVKLVYSAEHEYMSIDGQKMLLSAVSEFAGGNHQKPLEGRVPEYDNEIMTTKITADYLEKQIGDTVGIEGQGQKRDYVITGYYQSSNDAGKIACVTYEGMRRIAPDFQYSSCEILLKDEEGLLQTMGQIKKMAKEENMNLKTEDVGEEIETSMKDAQAGILALVVLFYLLAVLMTGLVTFLLAVTLLKRQSREFAIQRSMGYPLRTLRLQFAFMFGLSGLMGAVLGLSAVYLFTDKMFGLLFQTIGIAQFHADVTILSVVLPVTVLACFLAVFSYLISRRIKNTGTRQLAGE